MSRSRLSSLQMLLDRVQKRAAEPRVTASEPGAVAAAPVVTVVPMSAAPVRAFVEPPIAVVPAAVVPAVPLVDPAPGPAAVTMPVEAPAAVEAPALAPAVETAAAVETPAPIPFVEAPDATLALPPAPASPDEIPHAASMPNARPPLPSEPLMLGESDIMSDSVAPVGDEADEGPPSAPRLREDLAVQADADDESRDEEAPIKTPPPESGRQQVSPPVLALEESSDGVDIDIEESTPTPEPPGAAATETPLASQAPEPVVAEQQGAVAPLDLVPESDMIAPPIQATLGGAPADPPVQLSVPIERPTGVRSIVVEAPEDEPPVMDLVGAIEAAVVADSQTPAPSPPVALAESAPAPAPPEVVAPLEVVAPPEPPPPAPEPLVLESEPAPPPSLLESVVPVPAHAPPPAPVRLMATAAAAGAAEAPPPVEVWASTFAPALRGEVATFVKKNATFAPETFGEALEASLALGERAP
ncbi:MAG TPA: hypothetical protein VJT73_01190 [Polyangiaceae bacterium]|nr:hypothetical protein [Polyangiaceae bacterium]